ncbi:uncharacterized protein LOC129987418 [Argiope bruennichi]|uniref:uncharacterized protein LOC129987418 n=1 Tax=Argiope bruennichi TaxID=94029 RepID=UPI00249404B2|nr:uncharacterized protein LOC129987418 [Argiope bruennichi]
MHYSIIIILILGLTVSALAQRRGTDHVFSTIFPACKPVGDAMRSKFVEFLRSGQIGPRACKGQNQATCTKNDVKKVRCAVTEAPSDECVAQIKAFIQGNECNA